MPAAQRTFVVLKALEEDSASIALGVSGSGQSSTGQFFQVGGRYLRKAEGSENTYLCIGVYHSLEQTRTLHPSLKEDDFLILSPAASLLLGSKTWFPTL